MSEVALNANVGVNQILSTVLNVLFLAVTSEVEEEGGTALDTNILVEDVSGAVGHVLSGTDAIAQVVVERTNQTNSCVECISDRTKWISDVRIDISGLSAIIEVSEIISQVAFIAVVGVVQVTAASGDVLEQTAILTQVVLGLAEPAVV